MLTPGKSEMKTLRAAGPLFLAIGAMFVSCRSTETEAPFSPVPYPDGLSEFVGYVRAGHLVVLNGPAGPGWRYYTFSNRMNGLRSAFSRDGELIAYTRKEQDTTGTWVEGIEIVSMATGERVSLENFEATSLSFSPSGDKLAILGLDGTLQTGYSRRGLFVWDWKQDVVKHVTPSVRAYRFGGRSEPISWLDPNTLVIEGTDAEVVCFDIDGEELPTVLAKGEKPSVSPDGRWVAYKHSGKFWLCAIEDGSEGLLFDVPSTWDSRVIWSSDSQFLCYVRASKNGERDYPLCVLRLSDRSEFTVERVGEWQIYFGFIRPDVLERFPSED